MKTKPVEFKNPHNWKNKGGRALWQFVYVLLFRPSPRFLNGWRSWLLRSFGAKIKFAHIHPTVRIWAPWLLELGEHVYIDRDVKLYDVFGICIGDRVIISEKSYLCSASHNYKKASYPLIGERILVHDDCWIAADCFVGPGVTVEQGAVVGARSVVVKDVEAWTVVAGNPAKRVRDRVLKDVEK